MPKGQDGPWLLLLSIRAKLPATVRSTENPMADSNLSSFIWSVADLLRGDYKQSEYGKVILPFTVLRRLDCVLEPSKAAVLAELAKRKGAGVNPEQYLLRKSGQLFCNTSPLDLKKLMGDQDHIGENLRKYLEAFSPAVRDIFERFEFHTQIDRLSKAGLLYLVTEEFATIDLHPGAVSNAEMGAVFEELIRKFAELSNETAGEHFTPREVIRLMVNLLFIEDDEALTKPPKDSQAITKNHAAALAVFKDAYLVEFLNEWSRTCARAFGACATWSIMAGAARPWLSPSLRLPAAGLASDSCNRAFRNEHRTPHPPRGLRAHQEMAGRWS